MIAIVALVFAHCATFGMVEGVLQHLSSQPNVMYGTRIVHLAAPLALRDLMPQIWQRDVGAETHDQIFFAVLTRASVLYHTRHAPCRGGIK